MGQQLIAPVGGTVLPGSSEEGCEKLTSGVSKGENGNKCLAEGVGSPHR